MLFPQLEAYAAYNQTASVCVLIWKMDYTYSYFFLGAFELRDLNACTLHCSEDEQMNTALIAPVLAQVGLSLVTLLILYAYRIPALAIAKPSNEILQDPRSLDKLPKQARFAGQNYNHQFEAPVLFYVLCIVAMVAGLGDGTTVTIAWAYVALRVVHSIVHITYNRVMHRFAVFSLSS